MINIIYININKMVRTKRLLNKNHKKKKKKMPKKKKQQDINQQQQHQHIKVHVNNE